MYEVIKMKIKGEIRTSKRKKYKVKIIKVCLGIFQEILNVVWGQIV